MDSRIKQLPISSDGSGNNNNNNTFNFILHDYMIALKFLEMTPKYHYC